MRLAEKYRPKGLADVVGQSCTAKLKRFAKAPFSTGWLFQGSAGIGKTATALALAADLGAADEMSGLTVVCTATMGVEDAERIIRRLWTRPLCGEWHVLVLEELERLSPQCQVFLKVALASENLPPRAVVIATSNDTSLICAPLLERFGAPLTFDNWESMAQAGSARIAALWAAESEGAPLPYHARNWGWFTEGGKRTRYSLRAALDAMQQSLLELPEGLVAA